MKTIDAKAEMMIRKPVAEVFAAFINPEITRNFWFTKGSGKLETGADIVWEWEMYGVSANVHVVAVEANKRILIRWDDGDEVEWLFSERDANESYVTIINRGFKGRMMRLFRRRWIQFRALQPCFVV